MKVLITGGAGFVGRHLASALSQRSTCSIAVLDNLYRGSRAELEQMSNVEFIDGDVRDRDFLADLMTGVDILFHLAAQSNVVGATLDLDYSFSTNVAGTFNVLGAAKRAGIKRVVFTSSREVYGEQ